MRGRCRQGHVTDTTAAKGRTTWKGPCATDGCTLEVVCRRIPTTARNQPDPSPPAAGGKKVKKPPRYKVVEGYDDEPTPGFDDEPGRSPGSGEGPPAGIQPDPPDDDGAPRGGPPPRVDDDTDEGQRRRRPGRLGRSRRGGGPPGDLSDRFRVIDGVY